MALVEEAAAYLDEEGKDAARSLSHQAATLYAAESMRLTSRLMHIASWLLLLRASRSGDMSRDMVAREKAKVSLETLSAGESAKGWQELPETFRDMIARSLHLQDRVRCMDGDSYHKQIRELVECKGNAVSDQIVLLRTAFGGN
jgi:regulator of CtrA degradation